MLLMVLMVIPSLLPIVLLFAVLAAVNRILLVGQHEDRRQTLLNRGNATRIAAMNNILNFDRKCKLTLLNDVSILDDINRDVMIDEAQDIEIDGTNGTFDLQDIFSAHLVGLNVHDDSNRVVLVIES